MNIYHQPDSFAFNQILNTRPQFSFTYRVGEMRFSSVGSNSPVQVGTTGRTSAARVVFSASGKL